MAVKERVAIVSTLVNLILGLAKIGVGSITNSMGVMAEGVHSSLDVLSSFITYIGIKVSLKPVDAKHPYGYYRSETIAGLFVSIIVLVSTLWVLYEGIARLLNPSPFGTNLLALVVMSVSAITNFVMSRLKFKYGSKYESMALIADARHSEIDVFTSLAVLVGVVFSPYFAAVDSYAAILVGLIMIKKGIEIGSETTERLLDVSAGNGIESKIKEIAEKVPKVSKAQDIRTRKIGSNIFAELSLKVDPGLKVEHADIISKEVENKLTSLIPGLKHITIQIKPLEFVSKSAFGSFGYGFRRTGKFEEIGPKKVGTRVIIPMLDEKTLNPKFGSAKYLLVDVDGGEIVRKELIENPYFEKEYGHGTRFAKSVKADKIIVKQIGPNARNNLESQGIEVEVTNKSLEQIMGGLTSK